VYQVAAPFRKTKEIWEKMNVNGKRREIGLHELDCADIF